ncbi:MAG: FtsQ-type POTRA domain-containing protein [Actinomycetia bacterium]|nr:FtsQ-type POTRA domain-containing protein [Actinomycetes bacterium]
MKRRKVIIGALVAVVALGGWLVAASPVLGVSRVVVRGERALSSARVEQAAQVPHGKPLVRLDTGAIARRVEALPEVSAARVAVSYPSTVVITVTEWQPVGYISLGGLAELVDRSGAQYRAVAKPPAELPRLDLPPGPDQQAVAAAVATVAASLTPAMRARLSVIEARAADAIVLRLRDGRSVVWGGAERSAQKAQLLTALLKQPGTVFDVSSPGLAVAK